MEEPKKELNNSKISTPGNLEETEPFSGNADQNDSLFDNLMKEIGSAGKFQRRFNFLYNFVFVTVFTMPYLNIILVMTIPEHWCHVPGREMTNYSLEEWKEQWLPRSQKEGTTPFDSCKMYTEINNTRQSAVDCQYGWDFDRQWYTETVVSQESWVCNKEIYVSNTFAAGRVGEIIGTLVFGHLGDRFGRKPVFYLSVTILILGRIMSVFTSPYYHVFLITIAIGSLASTSVYQSPLVISMEVSDEEKRSFIAFLQCAGWVLGLCVLAFLAWGLKEWKLIMVLSTLPSGLCFICYKMLPESPRWLASRGKTEQAVEVLKYIASVNKTRIPRNTYSVLEKIGNKKEKFLGLASLFANFRLAKNTIIIVTCWYVALALQDSSPSFPYWYPDVSLHGTVSSGCYYVITLNVTNMSGNPFLNFLGQSVVELPGYILGKVLSEKLGRRWTQTGSYAIGSVFCFFTILAQCFNARYLEIYLVALIKLILTTSFYMVWLQAIEIYPTCVRQTGTSVGGVVANAFGILWPYVVFMGNSIDIRIPYLFMLGLVILGGVSSSFLPETLNKKLPETLEDAKVFGKNQKYWSFSINKR